MLGADHYPENRLDIRIDENGHLFFEQNPIFAKYFAPSREDLEEELENLQDQLDMLNLDEPDDILSTEYDEWEDQKNSLEEQILRIEEALEQFK